MHSPKVIANVLHNYLDTETYWTGHDGKNYRRFLEQLCIAIIEQMFYNLVTPHRNELIRRKEAAMGEIDRVIVNEFQELNNEDKMKIILLALSLSGSAQAETLSETGQEYQGGQ